MITANNITKTFGEQILFSNSSFMINKGEKIGLIGRNGAGKSTLLKIICGIEEIDEGDISLPKDYKLGYLEQHISFTENTVLEETCKSLAEDSEQWQAEKILSGLGFSESDMNRHPTQFSGGYQIRINLAKLLVAQPDALLLDEPGNYLDILSIRWLIRFLKEWKKELILITHDRDFMDQVISHTVGIHRQKIRKIQGGTSQFYNQILLEEEMHEKTRLNDQKKRAQIEMFINRFRAKATLASRVKSKEKMLEKQEEKEKLIDLKTLDFQFTYQQFEAKQILQTTNLTFGWNNQKLFENLNFQVKPNSRIAIIGKNGKGKTTLLKVLANKLNPISGSTHFHPSTHIGYFEQTNIELLNPQLTVEEELAASITDRTHYKARNLAGLMMFEGDHALKKIANLSGGEKSRVLLGKLLCTPTNILLLDEPTNHFDMETTESILQAIEHYPGAVIIVTHNEDYLHAIAEQLIVFDNNQAFFFDGNYQDFLDKIGWEDEKKDYPEKNENLKKKDASSQKLLRQKRAQIIHEKSKKLKPLEAKITKHEESIATMEKELKIHNEKFEIATLENQGEQIIALSKIITELEATISHVYEELCELVDMCETEASIFNERLKEFE